MWMLDMSWEIRVESDFSDCNTMCTVCLYVSLTSACETLTISSDIVRNCARFADRVSSQVRLVAPAAELDPAETTTLPMCQQSPNTRASASG
ncbi:hypothetical protein ASPTUDRAFT_136629 [Aspergillus tubingensis CBS 134.48]|uniref:Uncharacterized protein n=1 Tax=Aspergillus tubingensis (strain CBS 134.48) TaxID=767770 RepID=A0A1L9NF51_ASPTC|nr:hypothetical protein ASPTUDRAFT_136629 [Aspergillus tubingensis CBS 134.48]